jgi:hypothetical protein
LCGRIRSRKAGALIASAYVVGNEGCNMKQSWIKRLAHIETLSRQMAQSGAYEDSQSIEQSLVALGYAEEIRQLSKADIRFELDRICWRAVEQTKVCRVAVSP